MNLGSILPHPAMSYSLFNQPILEIDPVQTKRTELDIYLPIPYKPINNRCQDTIGTVNNTYIADSPSSNSYLEETPKNSKDQSLNKSSQTILSFSNKPYTIESSEYSASHTALSLLRSMDQHERRTKNNAGYILQTQKNRLKVLQDLNIEMTKINNTEAQRNYTINCARKGTYYKNPIDST